MNVWEEVIVEETKADGLISTLERTPVPGGWIYRTIVCAGCEDTETQTCALVFVPEAQA